MGSERLRSRAEKVLRPTALREIVMRAAAHTTPRRDGGSMHRLAPLLVLLSCVAAVGAQSITTAQLENAASDTSSWLSYGRDPFAQRFVRLTQITPANVTRLRPAWVFATGGDNRGLQATPLVHKGVLYLSADQSRVFAIDARTGRKKWSYDPKVGKDVERVYCCGSNNRGVALWGDLVFVGTMDARLIALHRDDGHVVWETRVIDWQGGYSITGAPRREGHGADRRRRR